MITRKNCLRQYGDNDLEVVAPGRSPDLFMIVTGREVSSLRACTGSHEFSYYQEVVEEIRASTLYMKEVKIPSLSMFLDHGYLSGVERVSQNRISRIHHSK